jgi:hypothetical protein
MANQELSDYEKLKKQHDIGEMWKQRGIWAKRGLYASIGMLLIILICAAIAMLGNTK